MTNNLLTEDLAPRPVSASSSMSQPAGDHFLNGIPPSDGKKSMGLGMYDRVQNAVSGYITDPAPSTGTPAEPIHLQPLPVNDEQVSNTDQRSEGTLGQPSGSTNSSFTSEGDDPEQAGQSTPGEGHDSDETTSTRSKPTLMWTLAPIVGVLLIVVPGLTVGIVTGQLQWGIALCGAIATVASLFAGLYCHHKK